ncbi:MAG: PAS domain S-box protein, partial [bacterium]
MKDERKTKKELIAELNQLRTTLSRVESPDQTADDTKRYKDLFENMIDGFAYHKMIYDSKGRPDDYIFLEINSAFEELTTLKKEKVIGKRVTEILPGIKESGFDWIWTYGRVAKTGEPVRFEQYFEPLDRWYSVHAYSPERDYFAATFENITEIKQTQEKLRKSEEKYRAVVEGTNDLVTIVDTEGKFTFVNHTAGRIFGMPAQECVGLSAFDFISTEDKERTRKWYERCVNNGIETAEVENRQVNPQTGEIYHMLWRSNFHYDETGKCVHVRSIARDITERKKIQAQLQHAQKLESLGILAGGIAHDFNNMLMGILGNAGLTLMKMSPDSPAVNHVQQIESTAKQAADLTNQMLAYSGKGKFVVQTLDLSELINEMLHLLKTIVSKNVILKFNLPENTPPIEADASQLGQIVLNLITNASDAVGAKSGVVTVTVGAMECDEEYLAGSYLDEEFPSGRYSFIEVSDTGNGMDDELMDRMFDPFFTTKETGRGLGLAAILGIVRGHKGAIRVYSEPGRGSTFKVLFPISRSGVAPRQSPEQVSSITGWKGDGTVLVVDDDETVRTVSGMILEEYGFKILSAADGKEGLEVYMQQKDDIVLVLLDMTMPRMGGEEAFREMRRVNPDVKVILTSGYNEQDATSAFFGKGLAGFIQKPYRPDELISKVKEV